MKLKQIAIATALVGSFSLAHAGDKGIGDGTLPDFLEKFDTNGDGVIDEEERQAIKDLRAERRKERRDAIDTDGDGEISEEEKEAARAAIRERIEARRTEHFNEVAGEDGVIDREEFGAIPHLADATDEIVDAIFARLDADGNGEISLEEFMDRLRHHGDRDQDGEPRPRLGDGPEEPAGE